MKHRLAPLLEGMEMGKSEHDWLEQRLESMTAKEELLFRGAMQIESPRDIQTTIQILQGLDHYQLLYGAEDDVLLGRFVMEHIHTPTHAARGYLDPEIVGAAYREHGSGSFVENHYVERLNPDRPLPEVNPNMPLPNTGEYAIRIKLVSRNNMEGVWIGFPDTGEYMDAVHPDELLLGLDALQAETLDQCMAVDVDCALPQITDILNQYDSAGELVRHAIDFGYVWAEQGQGEPHWLEKWMCVMELEDCHRLDLALDLAQNLHCYEYIPRGVDLAQYGMDLARKEGVLGQDQAPHQMLFYHFFRFLRRHLDVGDLLFAGRKHFHNRLILAQADAAGLCDNYIIQSLFPHQLRQAVEYRPGAAGNAAGGHTDNHTGLISVRFAHADLSLHPFTDRFEFFQRFHIANPPKIS